jgi:hypothetical protein
MTIKKGKAISGPAFIVKEQASLRGFFKVYFL